MPVESMPGTVQEALVTMTCFDDIGAQIQAVVPIEYYDAAFRKIARKAYTYRDQFRRPPGDHLIEIIGELCDEDPDNEESYQRMYVSMVSCKDGINKDYILGKAQNFVYMQRVKTAILAAVPLVNAGNLEAAEALVLPAFKRDDHLFKPGLRISNVRQILDVLNHQPESFPTGIEMLDKKHIGPCRKELYTYVAPPKCGKTSHMTHLGKSACVLGHLKVLHITLEMSEARMAMRYLQSFFSVSRRKDQFKRCKFEVDQWGSFLSADMVDIEERPSFEDADIGTVLQGEVGRFSGRWQLLIKEFPTGSLTIAGLKHYLDQLEVSDGFIPDLLILDYADLMEIDPKNQWQCLGKLTQDLRGLAVERNIAVVTASQTTRAGAKAKRTRTTDVAGDWTKIATADTIVVYSQTPDEKRCGLARLGVVARNEEELVQVVISQNYGLGQFCFDSANGTSRYDQYVKALRPVGSSDNDDEDDTPPPRTNGHSNGHANGHNGHVNGRNGNGRVAPRPLAANGHANGTGGPSRLTNGTNGQSGGFTEFNRFSGTNGD